MKSSKSQKNITIITDRKTHYDILANQCHSSLNKGSKTCTNQGHKSPCNRIPLSCKNLVQNGQINFNRDNDASDKKSRRQRSTSSKNRSENVHTQQNRKKQLDLLCFQRIINQIKKYIIERQQVWNFGCLCYGQLIKLLWVCRFVAYTNQQQFIQCNQQAELKKIYLLWLSISLKKIFTLRDFLIFVQVIENIHVEIDKIQVIITTAQTQIKQYCSKTYEDFKEDPNYTFFMKRIQFPRVNSHLLISQTLREKLVQDFKSFKLNKLKDTGIYQCVKVQQEQIVLSKKSNQLADQKRKKIQNKIRQKKPHVQNIDLLDLLSYRERDHVQSIKKSANANSSATNMKKSAPAPRRGQIKRQLELLSKPKVHFQERKQDEICFEKEQDQFTFHPKINPYRSSCRQKILQIKNVDKVLVRMKQARKLKQQKETIIQKGWNNPQKSDNMKLSVKTKLTFNQTPTFQNIQNKQNIQSPFFERDQANFSSSNKKQIQFNQNNQSGEKISHNEFHSHPYNSHPSERQQLQKPKSSKVHKYEVSKDYLRIPILYIDVNIEQGKKQRIIIYDNDKADVLARQFGDKHKLTEETISRLETLLQQQMDTVLARIQEQTDDQCSIAY